MWDKKRIGGDGAISKGFPKSLPLKLIVRKLEVGKRTSTGKGTKVWENFDVWRNVTTLHTKLLDILNDSICSFSSALFSLSPLGVDVYYNLLLIHPPSSHHSSSSPGEFLLNLQD